MFRGAVSGWLFIIFFVLHNVNVNRGLLQVDTVFLFLLASCIINILLYLLGIRLFGNPGKAAVFAFGLSFIFLFFGNLQDMLSEFPVTGRYTGLKYFLPASLLVIVLMTAWLYRSSGTFRMAPVFLSALGLVLISYEGILFLVSPEGRKPFRDSLVADQKKGLAGICDSCKKPDIFFFLLDEYTGSAGLQKDFDYDNSRFEFQLADRDFRTIPEARSPYILTVFAMASMLNMDLMTDTSRQSVHNNLDYQLALRSINNNSVCQFLVNRGYVIRNLSPFDLPQAPSSFSGSFNPTGISLLYYKTIYGRVNRDLPFLLRAKGMDDWNQQFNKRILVNNHIAMAEVIKAVPATKPVFTYAHLFMPHAPFAYDSLGQRIPESVGKSLKADCADYLQYLVYTNKQLIQCIDQLKKNTHNQAVIILASDHGYRAGCAAGSKEAAHSVLLSYYLPQEYPKIEVKAGISNVHAFRILFNTIFQTDLSIQ